MPQPRLTASRLKSDMGPFSLLPEWVRTAEISDKAKLLYAYLLGLANLPGGAFPSYNTMAKENNCSKASVRRYIEELVKLGALSKVPRSRQNGSQTSNQYIVHTVQQELPDVWTPGEWADLEGVRPDEHP